MAEIVCPKCGTVLQEGTKFCSKCGTPLLNAANSNDYRDFRENKRKAMYVLIGVVILLFLIILGATAYSDYSEKRMIRLAHEKAIKDSLEAARQDSILIAEAKEREKKDAASFVEFRKKMTFENFVALVKDSENEKYAKKCGLSLIYKEVHDYDEIVDIEIVYGYDVKKGNDNTIEAQSKYSCYYQYNQETSTGAALYFNDLSSANDFWNEALKYGLIIYGDMCFIPNKKLPNGTIEKNVDEDFGDEKYTPLYPIESPKYENGWYVINIGMDW